MSIVTRNGDDGSTRLFGPNRLSKDSLCFEALGTLDELGSVLCLVRASTAPTIHQHQLTVLIDHHLPRIMAEVSIRAEINQDAPHSDESSALAQMLAEIESWVKELESTLQPPHGWFRPTTIEASFADLARTVCRRAERCMVRFKNTGSSVPLQLLAYLNRLGDYLWLLARFLDQGKKPS